MSASLFKPLRYRRRWFCYLDLLGFTALVNDGNIEKIIPTYQEVLNKLSMKAGAHSGRGIIHSWFSDTFIIYSKSDSDEEFALVEGVGRQFFQELLLNGIPARGAITHGSLYSQSSKNIFVGQALIDAYHYAEKQNWLGFILTPKACEKLNSSSIPSHTLTNYRVVKQPGIILHEPANPIYAFAFNNGLVGGNNPYIPALQKMMLSSEEKYWPKYENAIAFAKEHMRPDARASIT